MAINKSTILQNAQRFTAKGQIDSAIEEWQKLIAETPNDGNIYNTIGDLYLKKNAIKDAVAVYFKAANAFHDAGFALKTIAVYKKIIKLAPERRDACLKLAELNAERGLVGNAIEDYLNIAKQYTKEGDVAEALNVYRKIADLDPSNTHIRVKIAELCIKEDLKSEAVEEYLKAAEVLQSQSKGKEAEEVYQRVVQIDPKNERARAGITGLQSGDAPNVSVNQETDPLSMVDSLISADKLGEAEQILRDAIKQSRKPEYQEKLAHLLLKRKENEAAFQEFENLVRYWNEKNKYKTSEKLLGDFVNAIPDHIPAMVLLAAVYEHSGQKGLALETHEKLINLCLERGDKIEAKRFYQRLSELDPRHELIKKLAAEFEEKKVVIEEVIQSEESESADLKIPIVHMDPEQIQSHLTEAEVYLKYGLINKAIEQLETVLAGDPENIPAHMHLKEIYKSEQETSKAIKECLVLAEIYKTTGDNSQRQAIFDQVLKLDPNNQVALDEQGQRDQMEVGIPEIIEAEPPVLDVSSPSELSPTADTDQSIVDLLAEADFYVQQGLLEEAKKIYRKIISLNPENAQAQLKLAEIATEEELSKEIEAISMDSSVNDAVQQAESEKPQEPEGIAVPSADMDRPILEATVPSPMSVSPEVEGFIDLTQIFKEDLEEVYKEPIRDKETAGMEEFDQIFRDFQKGVQKEFGEEDYETHYNLGIAYKEMGLINEAINEFQLSLRGTERFIDSCSMIATCYQIRGLNKLAIDQLVKALEDPRCDSQSAQWLRYELGLLYEGDGKPEQAYEQLLEVYRVDQNFRDVKSRLETLKEKRRSSPVTNSFINEKALPEVLAEQALAKANRLDDSSRADTKKKGRVSYL